MGSSRSRKTQPQTRIHQGLHREEEYARKGRVLRARTKWFKDGERPSKAFFNTVKARQKRTYIKVLAGLRNGSIRALLEIVERYYKNLYSYKPSVQRKLEKLVSGLRNLLSAESRERLEREITLEELSIAVKKMQVDRAPGVDGFTVNLYQKCPVLLESLLKVWQTAVRVRRLPPEMRIGIITLLPKQGDLESLNNWRPITLLSTDYKIFAKVLSLRLAAVVREVVGVNQTGFIPGRNIHTNVLEARLVHELGIREKKNGAIVFYDFQKAYDKLGHEYLSACLRECGFGEKFRGVRRYTDISWSCDSPGQRVLHEDVRLVGGGEARVPVVTFVVCCRHRAAATGN